METANDKDTSTLVQEVLDAAKKTEVVTQEAGKETTLETSDTKDTKESKGKAAERIQELVAERNRAIEALKLTQKEAEAAKQREFEFKTGYSELASLVESIKELAAHDDTKVRDAVMLVDQVLKGDYKGPTVANPAEQSKQDTSKELLSKLDALKQEVNSKLEDNSQQVLLNTYKDSAKEALDNLPKEYTDKDKDRIAKTFHDFVNWDKANENPLQMDLIVQQALKAALDDYGDPIGKVEARVREELKAKEPEAKRFSPKEQMDKLKEVPWDKADDKGKTLMTDQDFVKALAAAYKYDKGNI